MNRDQALQIQSYLDGELKGRSARQVADWIETDAQARALYEELRKTRSVLSPEAELPRALEVSREFYWSQVERAIERAQAKAEGADRTVPAWWAALRRYAAPLTAAAVVLLLAVPASQRLSGDMGDPYLAHLAEIQNPSEEIGSHSFRSRSGMLVVWLYERSPVVLDTADLSEEILGQ